MAAFTSPPAKPKGHPSSWICALTPLKSKGVRFTSACPNEKRRANSKRPCDARKAASGNQLLAGRTTVRSNNIQLAVLGSRSTAPLGGAIPRQKKMKKIKSSKTLLLAIATMVIAPFATFAADAPGKIKIGVTMSSFGHVFHIDIMNGMKKWAQAHPDVELSMVDARDDSAKQTGQVENFLAQGMDAVIVQPVDAS